MVHSIENGGFAGLLCNKYKRKVDQLRDGYAV